MMEIDEALDLAEKTPNEYMTGVRTVGEAPIAFALYGMAGLGKTEIANEYVHSRKDKLSAIFWVQASTTQTSAPTSKLTAQGLMRGEARRCDYLPCH